MPTNSHHWLRKPSLYPLSYEGALDAKVPDDFRFRVPIDLTLLQSLSESTGHPLSSFLPSAHTQRSLECRRAHKEIPLVEWAAYHSLPNAEFLRPERVED